MSSGCRSASPTGECAPVGDAASGGGWFMVVVVVVVVVVLVAG
jgi:hypothetical protein